MNIEFYIVDDYDRPWHEAIAALFPSDGRLHYVFNSKQKTNWPGMAINRPTPIADFGVDILVNPESGTIYGRKNRESTAYYGFPHQGKHREWQGPDEFFFHPNEHFVREFIKP